MNTRRIIGIARQMARYALVGGSGFVVDVGVFALCRLLYARDLVMANILARLGGALWTYLMNHHWTFRSSGGRLAPRPALCHPLVYQYLAFDPGHLPGDPTYRRG